MQPGSFIINGLKSQDVHAVITNWFDIPRPARKITLNTSPVGLDRALIVDDGNYENREFTMNVGVRGDYETNCQKLLNTIDSGGYIDGQFYVDEKYTYQIVSTDAIEATRLGRSASYRELSIKFSTAPFKYVIGTANVEVTDTATLSNPFGYASKPVITLKGSGDFALTVNDTVINLTGIDDEIVLDSTLCDAYKVVSGTVYNLNSQMSHSDYPILKSGGNKITVSGCTATVEPRWRTL